MEVKTRILAAIDGSMMVIRSARCSAVFHATDGNTAEVVFDLEWEGGYSSRTALPGMPRPVADLFIVGRSYDIEITRRLPEEGREGGVSEDLGVFVPDGTPIEALCEDPAAGGD